MNTLIIILVLVVLVFLAIKIVKGLLKVAIWIVIFAGVLVLANYLVLPRIGYKPMKLGLENFFKSETVKGTKEKVEKIVEEKVGEITKGKRKGVVSEFKKKATEIQEKVETRYKKILGGLEN